MAKRKDFDEVVIKLFEIARLIFVSMAFFLSFYDIPNAAFYLVYGMVLPLNGFLVIEGLFWGDVSAKYKGRTPSPYQLQSICFNLSIFIVALAVIILNVGFNAQVVVVIITVLFFLFSGIIHLCEYAKNKIRVNLWRFIGSVLMFGFSLSALYLQYMRTF